MRRAEREEFSLRLSLLLIAGVVVLALLLTGADLILASLSYERLRPVLEERLTDDLGLKVLLSGDLELQLLPSPHFEAHEITVENPPGRRSPNLLQIERLDLNLQLLPLLRRTVVIDSLEIYGAELRVEFDEDGRFTSTVEEADDSSADTAAGATELHVAEVHVEGLRVYYGEQERAVLEVEVLDVEAEPRTSPVSATVVGEIDGRPFELEARLGSLAELLEPTGPYPLELRGRVHEAGFDMQGTIDSPAELSGIDMRFGARLDEPRTLLPDLDSRVPDLPVQVSGRLRDREGTLGVESLVVRAGLERPLQVVIEGSVRDLIGFDGIELEIRAEADDTALVQELVQTPLPDVPISAELQLSVDGGRLRAKGEARVGRDEVPSLELDLNAKLRKSEGRFGFYDIRARASRRKEAWAEVTGSLLDVLEFRGVQLDARFGAAEVQTLAASVGLEIPPLGRLEGSVSISDRDGSLGAESADLKVRRKGGFSFHLRGSFDDFRELGQIEVAANLESRDLSALGALVDVELPAVGPVSFSGRVRGSNERLVSKGSVRLNRTLLEGEWTAVFGEGLRRSLTARFRSPHIFLADLGIEPGGERAGPARATEGRSALQRWWSDGEPAPLEKLRELDLDVIVQADRVSGRGGLDIRNLRGVLVLDDGELVVRDGVGAYEGGRVEGNLRVDARPAKPVWELQLETFNVDTTALMSQFQKDTQQTGLLDLSIHLSSRGRTRQEVVSNLNGHLAGMLREGSLVSRYSQAFSVDFLRVSLPGFQPDLDAPPIVQCLLGHLTVERGLAEAETLYLEGRNGTITGTGRFDLAANELDLRLTPQVHDPGLVSAAFTVEVEGPLEDPVLRPVKSSVGASLVRGLVRNAMRPGRALERRLTGRTGERPDLCSPVVLKRNRERETLEIEGEGGAFQAASQGDQ